MIIKDLNIPFSRWSLIAYCVSLNFKIHRENIEVQGNKLLLKQSFIKNNLICWSVLETMKKTAN